MSKKALLLMKTVLFSTTYFILMVYSQSYECEKSGIYSFLYGTAISTVFWKYGIEAFMEVPSIQDLIITPVAGLIIGESFYRLKRTIIANGYRLFGSSLLGNVVAFVVDPVNEVIGIFAGNPNRKKLKESNNTLACMPWFNKTALYGNIFGVSLSLSF